MSRILIPLTLVVILVAAAYAQQQSIKCYVCQWGDKVPQSDSNCKDAKNLKDSHKETCYPRKALSGEKSPSLPAGARFAQLLNVDQTIADPKANALYCVKIDGKYGGKKAIIRTCVEGPEGKHGKCENDVVIDGQKADGKACFCTGEYCNSAGIPTIGLALPLLLSAAAKLFF